MKSGLVRIPRSLRIDLPEGQSAFLWGPRQTGKSTWLRENYPGSIYYDLLDTDVFFQLTKQPSLFREQLAAVPSAELKRLPIIVDEVQKIPALLDEIHGLIENRGWRFILCGSSARKLKRGQANLLGGRAWRFELFPLTTKELGDVDLLRALNNGLLPSHYPSSQPRRALKAYVQDYLKEEIMAESLVRHLPSFARFLDAVGYSHGGLVNYANIARDCAVDAKTVRSYFEILEDTLLGRFVPPLVTRQGRQTISAAAKFYLCDVGLAGYLCRRVIAEERGDLFGQALEHFTLMELWAHRAYQEKDYDIHFWRTKTGLEVDFVLNRGTIALEVKGASRIDDRELLGLRAFCSENPQAKAIVVGNEKRARQSGAILILPWHEFCERLWQGDII